jgi:spoIIIJ-associated protein
VSEDLNTARLEEEGDIAADYLEELLDVIDLDGDIDIDVDHGRAVIEIVAVDGNEGELNQLVGSDGSVLDALQQLTRLAVQNRTGDRSRLLVDVAGYRARRRIVLEDQARRAVAEINGGSERVALEPMNPFERKIVHDVVAEAGLISESEGEEPDRYVVIRAN